MNRATRTALDCVALSYGVPAHLILSASRKKDHVRARWLVVKLLRTRGLSTTNIARELGGMDHSSIVYALQRSQKMDTAWYRAYERSRGMFESRLSFFDGVKVYPAPIGPPRNPYVTQANDFDAKWIALTGERTFENAAVPKFTGHYVAAMSEAAASIAREV